MSQQTEIKKLLKKMYTNSVHLNEWNSDPQTTTKKWQIEVEDKELETIQTVVGHISNDLEQVQEVRYVNQYTVKKISDMTRHGIFSFYTMMALQVMTFILGLFVFCCGVYTLIQGSLFLGTFLGLFSFVPILYFFIKKPLQELNENIGNLVQMQVALGAWFNEMTYWQVYAKEPDLEERQMVAQTMRDATKWAVMLIEDYTSHKDKHQTNTKTYTETISKIRDLANKWKQNKEENKNRRLLEEKQKENLSTNADDKKSKQSEEQTEKKQTEEKQTEEKQTEEKNDKEDNTTNVNDTQNKKDKENTQNDETRESEKN